MNEDRLTDIEIKLAHAEQAITELSDVLYAQQAMLEKLQRSCDLLQQRISSMGEGPDSTAQDEKPPHY